MVIYLLDPNLRGEMSSDYESYIKDLMSRFLYSDARDKTLAIEVSEI
jgi:hypothetical protein